MPSRPIRKRYLGGIGVPAQFGPPQYRPLRGTETRPNPDGYSTEITMTDQTPGQRWEVYPSLWMGPNGPVEMPRRQAKATADQYEKFGYQFPRFPDLTSSEAWATARSRQGGVGTGPLAKTGRVRERGGGANVEIPVGSKSGSTVRGLGLDRFPIGYQPPLGGYNLPSQYWDDQQSNPSPQEQPVPPGWLPPNSSLGQQQMLEQLLQQRRSREPPPVQYRYAPTQRRVSPPMGRATWRDIVT
jgi:hypothetical protein